MGKYIDKRTQKHTCVIERTTRLSQVCPKLVPSLSQVDSDLFDILQMMEVPVGIDALMLKVGKTNRSSFRNTVLNPLLKHQYIVMTHPDKPTSPKQQYRLTEQGKALLKTW